MKIDVQKVSINFYPPDENRMFRDENEYFISFRVLFYKEDPPKEFNLQKGPLSISECELINNILIDKNQALLNKKIEHPDISVFVKLKLNSLLDIIPFTNFDDLKRFHENRKEMKSLLKRMHSAIKNKPSSYYAHDPDLPF